jgi:hypothetical protein
VAQFSVSEVAQFSMSVDMVPKGIGHGSLPAAEVVGVKHGGQTGTVKRILPRVLGEGTGQGRNGADGASNDSAARGLE